MPSDDSPSGAMQPSHQRVEVVPRTGRQIRGLDREIHGVERPDIGAGEHGADDGRVTRQLHQPGPLLSPSSIGLPSGREPDARAGKFGRDRNDGVEDATVDGQRMAGVRVAGLDGGLLGVRDGQQGSSGEHGAPCCVELILVEVHHRAESPGDLGHRPERIGCGPTDEPDDGDGQFGDPPRVHDVAEIDDPGGLETTDGVPPADHVEVGQIAMDDLARQRLAQGIEQGGGPRHGKVGDEEQRCVVDVAPEPRHDVGGVARIPLRDPMGARNLDAGQREHVVSGQPAEGPELLVVQFARPVHGLALHEGDHADRVAGCADDLVAVDRAHHHGVVEWRVTSRESGQHLVLSLHRPRRGARVGHLEHDLATVGELDVEVLILVGFEGPDLALEPPPVPRHGRSISDREIRAGPAVAVKAARRHLRFLPPSSAVHDELVTERPITGPNAASSPT